MRQRLKHIKTARKTLKDGTVRTHYYHRRTGKKIVGEPGTPEFLNSYAEASKLDSRTNPSTIQYLIELYITSSDFARLSDRTKLDHRRNRDAVLKRFGSAQIKVFEDKRIRQDIRDWRDTLAKTSPRQADYALAFLRRTLSYAYDNGLIDFNHATKLGLAYSGDRSESIWLPEHIDAFLQHASPQMSLAMRLALDTMQRQGDLIRLTWTAFDGRTIALRQRKGGTPVSIPCTALLLAELNRSERRAVTILTGKRGRPWTQDGFRTEWRKVALAAGIKGLTFHDLRGTGMTRLAESGCSVPEIATISGHSVDEVTRILETYLARTNKMAESAIAKLEEHRTKRAEKWKP
jgi:integrase